MGNKKRRLEWEEQYLNDHLDTPCHTCISHKPDIGGYIPYTVDGKKYLYHRYIYELTFGKLKKGYCVRHKCDNRACLNIDHLESGTYSENTQDMIRRGRYKGFIKKQTHPIAKLTVDQVRYIKNSQQKPSRLAKEFNVNLGTIYNILSGRTWIHIKSETDEIIEKPNTNSKEEIINVLESILNQIDKELPNNLEMTRAKAIIQTHLIEKLKST